MSGQSNSLNSCPGFGGAVLTVTKVRREQHRGPTGRKTLSALPPLGIKECGVDGLLGSQVIRSSVICAWEKLG